MSKATILHRLARFALLATGLIFLSTTIAVGVSGCGGDEPATSKPTRRKGKRKARSSGGKRRGGKRGARLITYSKIPDEYRHKFVERDFQPDITGDQNRDPFRSYVVQAPSKKTDKEPVDKTDVCNVNNSVAVNYSLRDLRLIGIVLRGTKSYALFRDSASFGHIVRRSDCLGKEEARVSAIGAGYVRLEVRPDAPPGAPPPEPQVRDIALYPEELSIEPQGQ